MPQITNTKLRTSLDNSESELRDEPTTPSIRNTHRCVHPASGYRTVIELPTVRSHSSRSPRSPRIKQRGSQISHTLWLSPFPFSRIHRPIRLQFKLSPVEAGSHQEPGIWCIEQEASTSCECSLCYQYFAGIFLPPATPGRHPDPSSASPRI